MNACLEQLAPGRARLAWPILIGLVVLAATGCTRKFYRRQADREVYSLIDSAADDPRWPLDNYTIQPDPRSRMYDPCNPDFPPMPPDDPTSHRLMHKVDGKRNARWLRYGRNGPVENHGWIDYLPYDDEGSALLDRETAVELALLHSRDYQSALEDLYLSALDVTFQRFRFDVQFFGNNSTVYTADGRVRGGGDSQSLLEVDTTGQARRLMATGGELVVGVANSLVWQFSGPDTNHAFTLLDFSLVQPLLRAGTRAVVLEGLTDAERALLANIRQMERFRRSFYTEVITGGGATPRGGLLGILEEQVRIRNREANVAALRDSKDLLKAFFDENRLESSYQLDLARQRLLSEQSGLLSETAAYESGLDAYKIRLGLPPDLKVHAEDALLKNFDLIAPAMTNVQNDVSSLLEILRVPDPDKPMPADYRQKLAAIQQDCLEQIRVVRGDLRRLEEALPQRRENLQKLAAGQRLENQNIEGVGDAAQLNTRAVEVFHDFSHLAEQMTFTLEEGLGLLLEGPAGAPPDAQPEPPRAELTEQVTTLSGQLLRLSLIQARARLDTVSLEPIELSPETALGIARENRRDWMNARATLVDQWRQIQVVANALRSDLNVTFSGDLGTVGDNMVRFSGANGRLRVGLQFDAPLTRLAERNEYRAVLIAYQRARRDYYAFEDEINRSLRDSLRAIQLSQLNFEVRRESIVVAVKRVDVARMELERKKGASPNITRDLVDALADLLAQQNSFLNVWVGYQTQRMGLDLDLGTMRLDDRGIWIDPGEIGPEGPSMAGGAGPTDAGQPVPGTEEVPPAEPVGGEQPEAAPLPPDIPAPP